jgi:cytochrome c553
MSLDRHGSPERRWTALAAGLTAALFLLAALVGLIALPYAQSDLKLAGLWDAICSAAGVVQKTPSSTAVGQVGGGTSNVVMTPDLFRSLDQESIGRGATLAHQCAICHGPAGISRADSPNLAGQYADAIYKQLQDFKNGARANAIMTPFARDLTDQQMIDVAAYYQYLPRLPEAQPSREAPPRIVLDGAPLRGIAPCGSCHGTLDKKAGSPWLNGQPAAYIKTQLEAFASGARRNDISGQMRNIAQQMTPAEIEAVAAYYGALTVP